MRRWWMRMRIRGGRKERKEGHERGDGDEDEDEKLTRKHTQIGVTFLHSSWAEILLPA
jgi:hypothetical protein